MARSIDGRQPGHRPAIDEARRNEQLRSRYKVGMPQGAFASLVVALVVPVLFWRVSNHVGLLIWSGLVIIQAIGMFSLAGEKRSYRDFYRLALGLEFFSGTAWGLLTLLAMPRDPTWQVFVVAILIAALMAGMLASSLLPGLFLIYVSSLSSLAILGFAIYGVGVAKWSVLLIVIFAAYVLASAPEIREVHNKLVELVLRLEEANERLDGQTRTDSLTRAANRFEFAQRLEAELAALGEPRRDGLTLAYLDLDGFKQINDGMGHQTGDLLLQAVANRLHGAVEGTTALVSRLGGDEFTVLSTDESAAELGERLHAAFIEPIVIDGGRIDVGLSIGIAETDEPMDADRFTRFADAALYRAKRQGGSGYVIFGPLMQHEFDRRAEVEGALGPALADGQITAYYQPIIDLHDGTIVGGEVLARWRRDDGVRDAAAFIDIAADLGLLDQITERFVDQLVEFRSALLVDGFDPPLVTLNLPVSQLNRFINRYEGSLSLEGMGIEIAPSGSGPVDRSWELIQRAHDAGVPVWLDNFGTGFLSMPTADGLPLHGLKVHAGLVAQMTTSDVARAVIASIVNLAERLDLELVAQGIESTSQLAVLRDLGVTRGQGYLFSPAIPMERFGEWLRSEHVFEVSDDRPHHRDGAVAPPSSG